MKRRLLAGAVLIGTLALGSRAPCAATPGDPAGFEQVLKLLAERRHGHVAFTEVQHLSILDRPLQSSGELSYDAPDRLEKRTLEPHPEDLLFEHGLLTIERNHRRRSVALRDFPQAAPFIESLRATLAGDRAALEHYFEVHFSGDLAAWRIELRPQDPAMRRTAALILIDGRQERIRTVEIRTSDGDTSTLSIGSDLAP
ncbi:MAG: outer membrane lipoprotein carrier protein LolA [Gammaproteobacteria bacterium]|nr:outer membrane lipoprotein carrier protein LolA [Gammaproteobacteria bacterium]